MKQDITKYFILTFLTLFSGGIGKADVLWEYDLQSREVVINKLSAHLTFPIPYYYSKQDGEIVFFSGSGDVYNVLTVDNGCAVNISNDGTIIYLQSGECISCGARVPVRTITRDNDEISSGEFNCVMFLSLEYSIEREQYFFPGGSVSGSMRFFDREFKHLNTGTLKEHDIIAHDHIMTQEMIICDFDEISSGYSRWSRTTHDSYIGAVSYEGEILWQYCAKDLMGGKHLSIEPNEDLIVYGYVNRDKNYSIVVMTFTGDEIQRHDFTSLNTAINSNLINGSVAIYDYDSELVSLYKLASGESELLFSTNKLETSIIMGRRFSVRNIKLFPNGYIALEYLLLSTTQDWTMTILYDSTGKMLDKAIGTESKHNSWNPHYLITDRILKSVADSISIKIEEIN